MYIYVLKPEVTGLERQVGGVILSKFFKLQDTGWVGDVIAVNSSGFLSLSVCVCELFCYTFLDNNNNGDEGGTATTLLLYFLYCFPGISFLFVVIDAGLRAFWLASLCLVMAVRSRGISSLSVSLRYFSFCRWS